MTEIVSSIKALLRVTNNNSRTLLNVAANSLTFVESIFKWTNPWLTILIGYLWTLMCVHAYYALLFCPLLPISLFFVKFQWQKPSLGNTTRDARILSNKLLQLQSYLETIKDIIQWRSKDSKFWLFSCLILLSIWIISIVLLGPNRVFCLLGWLILLLPLYQKPQKSKTVVFRFQCIEFCPLPLPENGPPLQLTGLSQETQEELQQIFVRSNATSCTWEWITEWELNLVYERKALCLFE